MADAMSDQEASIDFGVAMLCIAFIFVLLLLDAIFSVPRLDVIQRCINISCLVSGALCSYYLARHLLPDAMNRMAIGVPTNAKKVLDAAVVVATIVLLLHIKTAGGLPGSPYASLLSSFPFFCIIAIFGTVTIRSCFSAIAFIGALYLALYGLEVYLAESAKLQLVDPRLTDFMKSTTYTWLAFATLAITIASNVFSILLTQRATPSH